jgi:hypothetical protein
MRFLHLIRPVMCVLPEVASPDRKVRHDKMKSGGRDCGGDGDGDGDGGDRAIDSLA